MDFEGDRDDIEEEEEEEEIFPLTHQRSRRKPSEDDGDELNTGSLIEPSPINDAVSAISGVGTDDGEVSDSESEGWGRRKAAYYSTNAAEFGHGNEECDELYLQEAIRLQTKNRSSLSVGDFGLEDFLQSINTGFSHTK